MTSRTHKWLCSASCLSLLLLAAFAAADAPMGPNETDVVVGARGVNMDADGDRDAKFELKRDVPNGFVLDYLRWSQTFADNNDYVQLVAVDALQRDQRVGLRAGFADALKLRVDWNRTPQRFGDGAVYLPGMLTRNEYRIADFVQQRLEDPDGNGIPFYAEAGGVAGDNALAADLTDQLVDTSDLFSLASQRDEGGFDLEFRANDKLRMGFDYSREYRDGLKAVGSGTYQRITDVNGDGSTDYDYFFSVRGNELPTNLDYITTQLGAGVNYTDGKWFGTAKFTWSDFDSAFIGTTYDNPFWFTDTEATSGIRRGLWNEGRVSMPPSNKAWNLIFTGGVTLDHKTQITGTFARGQTKQTEQFLPITTNTALIGTGDINGDGSVNSADDPTSTSTLPMQNLDAKVNTTVVDLRVSSRPNRSVKLNGWFRSYDYGSDYPPMTDFWRAEYVESRLKPDFKGGALISIPIDYRRFRVGGDAAFRAGESAKITGFIEYIDRDYDQYVDTTGNGTRNTGTRAVDKVKETRFGAKLLWHGAPWMQGWFGYTRANQDFSGDYQVGFSGELESMRQYDIAKRNRDQLNVDVDFYSGDKMTLGVDFRFAKDNYPDTEYGLQEGKERGFVASFNYAAAQGVNVFAFGEVSQLERDSHLRTKCSNCTPPPGATWTSPWGVPNYDWFTEVTDKSVAIGAGMNYQPKARNYKVSILGNYTRGSIEQLAQNPGVPLDLANPGNIANVAVAQNFPDIENDVFRFEARLQRKIAKSVSLGVWYVFENFDLEDFRWDPMQPYGRNWLDVDDATRFLFLDSRYQDYKAHVIEGYLTFMF